MAGKSERNENPDAIVWHDGAATFRGFPVEIRAVEVAGISLCIAAMQDATHLLDQPDCAKRFLDADMAPYGVELWPAAIMLAEYIAQLKTIPRRALEIGCGLGLVSIVAARLGWPIIAGDHEPSALIFARHNAQLNNISSIDFTEFDWRQLLNGPQYDCILGADILYQLNNHAPIIRCLAGHLDPVGVALISDPNRGVADRFPDSASAAGFSVEVLPASTQMAQGRRIDGRIFRVYRAESISQTRLVSLT